MRTGNDANRNAQESELLRQQMRCSSGGLDISSVTSEERASSSSLGSSEMTLSVPASTVRSATPASLNLVSPEHPLQKGYVSRAEGKLAGAAQAFSYDFRGKTVLDIGSSTGGFTEYAIRHGAKKVIAVEKGTNQMKAPLRFDPRVELYEKTDIFDFKTTEKIDTILADVSFLSLTKVIAYAKMELACRETDWLLMLKPQFEARPEQLVKGVVKNEKMRREIISRFEGWLRNNGMIVVKKRDNEVKGKNGNRERFYFLKMAK